MRIKNKGGFKGKMKKPDSNLIFLYRAILMLQTEEECERFFDDLCTGPELKAIAPVSYTHLTLPTILLV